MTPNILKNINLVEHFSVYSILIISNNTLQDASNLQAWFGFKIDNCHCIIKHLFTNFAKFLSYIIVFFDFAIMLTYLFA